MQVTLYNAFLNVSAHIGDVEWAIVYLSICLPVSVFVCLRGYMSNCRRCLYTNDAIVRPVWINSVGVWNVFAINVAYPLCS